MIAISKTVLIQAKPLEVFSFLVDCSNHPKFAPALSKCVLLDDELQVGSRIVKSAIFLGQEQSNYLKVKEFQPNENLVFESYRGLVRSKESFHLQDTTVGTKLTFSVKVRLRGLLRLSEVLLKPVLETEVYRSLTNLKELVEAGLYEKVRN